MMAPTISAMTQFHQNEDEVNKDKELVELALQDMAHFRNLYEKYYESILRYIYQRVATKEEAFDITSQVFLNAMLNLKKYSFKGLPFSAWLYRIAMNEMNLLFRKNKNKRCINIDDTGLYNIIAELGNEQNEDKHTLLTSLLASLPVDEYEYIQMRFFEKRAFAEIGQLLGITENNAKVKTYRIIDKLKQLMMKNMKSN
jgi:RNA polymerase sigma-70 factor (ECF subfamily)